MAEELSRDDLAATVEARRELGAEHEPELVDAFLDRVEGAMEKRVDQVAAKRLPGRRGPAHLGRPVADWSAVLLGIVSVGSGVGATGAANGDAFVAIIAWIAIALVNVSYNLRGR